MEVAGLPGREFGAVLSVRDVQKSDFSEFPLGHGRNRIDFAGKDWKARVEESVDIFGLIPSSTHRLNWKIPANHIHSKLDLTLLRVNARSVNNK